MKEKKAVKKKSSRRVTKKPIVFGLQITDKELTEFESILNRLSGETDHSMSVGLDINNKLHSIKYNDIDKKAEPVDPAKGMDDLVGKFNAILERLSNANKLHDKNFYKLNKLF